MWHGERERFVGALCAHDTQVFGAESIDERPCRSKAL